MANDFGVSDATRAAIALDLIITIDKAIVALNPQTVGEVRAVLKGMKLAAEDILRNG